MELDDQKDNEAKTALQDAIDAGSKSARAWLELGRLQVRCGRAQEGQRAESSLG